MSTKPCSQSTWNTTSLEAFIEKHLPKPPALGTHLGSGVGTPNEQQASSVQSLFRSVLKGNPLSLYRDTLDHPEKYERDEVTLVERLVAEKRTPTPVEEQILSQMVYSMASRHTPFVRTTPRSVVKHQSPLRVERMPDNPWWLKTKSP